MPVKVANGKLVYFYATPIPELEDGAIGEVILPEWAVINMHALLLWQAEQAITLFEANTTLLLGMRDSSIPLHILEEVKDFPGSEGHKLIPILLLEPLRLLLRGTKKAVLRGGKCRIPVREGAARSINHAYTLASTYYEPERMSHSGNMFRRNYSDSLATPFRQKFPENSHFPERESGIKQETFVPNPNSFLKTAIFPNGEAGVFRKLRRRGKRE